MEPMAHGYCCYSAIYLGKKKAFFFFLVQPNHFNEQKACKDYSIWSPTYINRVKSSCTFLLSNSFVRAKGNPITNARRGE